LHKKLILTLAKESVLEAFNYLCQSFDTAFKRSLVAVFLEIQYYIFCYFKPEQLF